MDLPGRRRSGMGSVRHRAGPLREAGPVECTTSRSGKLRVPSPLPLGQARSGERNGNNEAHPVDCVRIVHKTSNVLNKLPRSVQPAAKADLREIWMAPDRATAEAAIATFAEKYAAKYGKAVTCLIKDRDALLTFYDFPAEHWDHLRTSNPNLITRQLQPV